MSPVTLSLTIRGIKISIESEKEMDVRLMSILLSYADANWNESEPKEYIHSGVSAYEWFKKGWTSENSISFSEIECIEAFQKTWN